MILVINTCKHKLHSAEFVKPIIDLLDDFKVKHFTELKKQDIEKADKIIISGTALKDNEARKHLKKFAWIKDLDKPLLGICMGMQLIGLIHEAEIYECNEIGPTKITITEKTQLIDKTELEAYELHDFATKLPKGFKEMAKSEKCLQIMQKGKICGMMFHPEVMNKEIILKFDRKD
ncbi:hypothetical protein GF343_05770 [Candidatus Woesearchaeota archaeon]|nr:hypothetical protein [Candidatus Woesearchaeota archaeon]